MRNVSIIQVIPAQVISHISSFERQSQKLLAPQLLLLPSSSGTFDSNKGQILQTPPTLTHTNTHTHTRKHTHRETGRAGTAKRTYISVCTAMSAAVGAI